MIEKKACAEYLDQSNLKKKDVDVTVIFNYS